MYALDFQPLNGYPLRREINMKSANARKAVITITPWGNEFVVRMQLVKENGDIEVISEMGTKYTLEPDAISAARAWAEEAHRTLNVFVEIQKSKVFEVLEPQ